MSNGISMATCVGLIKKYGGSSGGSSGNCDLTSVNKKIKANIDNIKKIEDDNNNIRFTIKNLNRKTIELETKNNDLYLETLKQNDTLMKLQQVNNENTDNISNIQDTLKNNKNGLVKMNLDDDSDYLDKKIDNDTIQIYNNKLIAKTLDGLEVSIEDINKLKGLKDNVQIQINSLTHAISIRGEVITHKDLLLLKNLENGDAYVVRRDEDHENNKTWYVWNDKGWLFLGTMDIHVRDFLFNPIDLIKETVGQLPENRIDNAIARKIDLYDKVDIIKNATEDDIAILTANGNIKDSSFKINDFAKAIHRHEDLEKEIKDISNNLFTIHEWERGKDYEKGSILIYNDKLYKVKYGIRNSTRIPELDVLNFQCISGEGSSNTEIELDINTLPTF